MNIREMWSDFSDYDLAQLAGEYGIADELVFNDRLQLANRSAIENRITFIEFNSAFPLEQESLDFNEEVAYN